MLRPKDFIKIGLVDDHALFRAGLKSLIDRDFSFNKTKLHIDVEFEVTNGKELIEYLKLNKPPDILFLDIHMPEMNGFDTANWLTQNHPSVKVIVLTMHSGGESLRKMLSYGINGYLTKNVDSKTILNAIQAVLNGEIFLSDEMASKLVMMTRSNGTDNKREALFLKLVCSELTYQEIANEMNVSPRTVDNIREFLFEKFNVKSRVGLVFYAIQQGFAEIDESFVRIDLPINVREILFLRLVCSDLTYKQVAEKMALSARTVDGYREILFDKLKVRSRVGLVLIAIKAGIVGIDHMKIENKSHRDNITQSIKLLKDKKS